MGYAALITEATGVSEALAVAKIEDLMRHVIFHSTLDWQSRAEFFKGAREAKEVMDEAAKLGIEV